MAPRMKICIPLKALIRTLHLNTSICSCCQRASWAWLVFLCSRRWERIRLEKVDLPWKCWTTCNETPRSFYAARRKNVMSNRVTDHLHRCFLGVSLVFSRVVFKMQRKHFVRGSSARQLHITVEFSCWFRERVVFLDHMKEGLVLLLHSCSTC